MQKQIIMLLLLLCSFHSLGETSSKKDNISFSGEFLYEHIDGNWGDYKFHTQTGRSRLWAKGNINDEWSYAAMLENMQDFHDKTGNEKLDFKSAYINGKIGGVKLQAGRYENILADDAVFDNWVDGIELTYGKKTNLRAFAGKANSAHIIVDTDTYYGEIPASYGKYCGAEVRKTFGKTNLLAGFTKFNNIQYVLPGSAKLHDNMNVKFYYLGVEVPLAVDLNASVKYVKGDLKTPQFDADDYIHNDGYTLTLQYKYADCLTPGSYDAYIIYYDRGGQTYMADTQNIDTFGLSNAAGMGLGIKGYCIGFDYVLAKNIATKIEYYNVNSKVPTVGTKKQNDSYLCTQLIFTF